MVSRIKIFIGIEYFLIYIYIITLGVTPFNSHKIYAMLSTMKGVI